MVANIHRSKHTQRRLNYYYHTARQKHAGREIYPAQVTWRWSYCSALILKGCCNVPLVFHCQSVVGIWGVFV